MMPSTLRRAESRANSGQRAFLLASLTRVVRTAEILLATLTRFQIVLDRRLAGHVIALRDACEKARSELGNEN